MLDPAWGYLDQPPLAPFLARTLSAVVDEPWALRVPATLSMAALVVVTTLLARELGGDHRAQRLAAWAAASASVPLAMAHVLLTSSLDLWVWPAVVLCAVRALLRDRPRWWLGAGLVAGLSTYDKLLVAVLGVALLAGLLATGPRAVLRSRHLLGGVLLAAVVAAPNLAYQAANDWPQLTVGAALAADDGAEVRASTLPMLLLLLGPPLVPVWLAGWVALARRPAWRRVRSLAVAAPVVVLLVLAMGSQNYYPMGVLTVLLAAGCVPVAGWCAGRRGRTRLVAGAVAANALVSAVVALPVVPVSVLGRTPVPAVNQVARDSLGWPRYVQQVAAVRAALPPGDRARSVVVTSNYGEAGAVDRFGPALGLDTVYSAHNALADQARPPEDATVVVFVGTTLDRARRVFTRCDVVDHLDSGLGVDGEEEGAPIAVCRNPVGGWSRAWPLLRHID
nr:glycosyltransferase family 39 protein [Kineococcus siccus]